MIPSPSEPIPTPPDFPVTWDNPESEASLWVLHDTDNPTAALPLDFSLRQQSMTAGGNKANAAFGLPFRAQHQLINSYLYTSHSPATLSKDDLAPLLRAAEEKMRAMLPQLGTLWSDTWLPEIKGHIAFWESFSLEGVSTRALITHLEETQQHLERLWELHFSLLSPAGLAISLFDDLVQDVTDQTSPFDAYDMLAGFENKTTAGDRQLWQLSRQALATPAIYKILQEVEASEVPAVLRQSEQGRAFWQTIEAYLQLYGQRNDSTHLQDATWLERPTPVIQHLQRYIQQQTPPATLDTDRAMTQREEKVANLRQQFAGYPQLMVREFEALLHAAQIGNVISEDHSYWIDYKTVYFVRQVCLEFGRRLRQNGLIDARDDVFFLTVEELKMLAAPPAKDYYRDQIQAVKADIARFAGITPPPVLGTPPDTPPPQQFDDALSRAALKFSGSLPPPDNETEPSDPNHHEIRGLPGSSGKACGPAKVLSGLHEAARLLPGDILVAQATLPPWTPLFATAAAIVTDTGGVLSHTAVVAREYGVPAVVGTQDATSRISDGQMIEVDGDTGLVRFI